MGAACSNSNKIVQSTVKRTGKKLKIETEDSDGNRDGVVSDPNANNFGSSNIERMHEKLWSAVEANDRAAADKFLELNDVQESNLYDPFG
jgi:hypothetical protein